MTILALSAAVRRLSQEVPPVAVMPSPRAWRAQTPKSRQRSAAGFAGAKPTSRKQQPLPVDQTVMGSAVVIGPGPATHQFAVESVELRYRADQPIDQQPLGDRGRPAARPDELRLKIAVKSADRATTVDHVADHAAPKPSRVGADHVAIFARLSHFPAGLIGQPLDMDAADHR